MKSKQTFSTDPQESGYPTSTNLKTTPRLAWCQTRLPSSISHRTIEG